MNSHIINCGEDLFFTSFLPNSYIGVSIVIKGTEPKQLKKACRTSYSMYADMKTVHKGDIVFVHAGKKIYGAFQATSEFCEEPTIPRNFLSNNIHYYPNPNIAGSGWEGNINVVPNLGYYRRLAIKNFVNEGVNLCFKNGVDSTEVFELKSKKRIWSIPERWKYTEARRTIRPLMIDESLELIKMIDIENAALSERQTVRSVDLRAYLPIRLILNPQIIQDEKIIEGWLLENIGRNRDLDDALGPLTSFGNNMPAGYLKFMDIFGYQELNYGTKLYKVIEIKKDACSFPDDVNQILGYLDWVGKNIAGGESKAVEGIIVANNFDTECEKFIRNFNTTSRHKIKLIKFDYNPPSFNKLNITRVI